MTTSFLRLNGIAVPVFHQNANAAKTPIGAFRRSVNGTGTVPRRTRKGVWRFDTTPKSAAEALAFRELVAGNGHVLSFDAQTPYTSAGMAPVALAVGWGYTTTAPKYGAACATMPASGALSTWAFFSSSSPWTIAFWSNYSGAFKHYVATSAGPAWVDGVAGFALSDCKGLDNVTAGVAAFGIASGGVTKLDDVVALPFVVPSDWPAQIYGFGSAFSALPVLTADGKFIEQDTAVTVIGGDEATARVMPVPGTKNIHAFSFELLER